ncbi:hypothetical protein MYCTH_2127280 [Thermothelomyces thermophilus ATCC 42464]|uniref:Uncharacterized protein n=1 Tax=Thermothelomyces thermophilus (strain ATCC 42464 / BCRC 31852 / DSM 1799) TaxID=573729 RepID=G2QD25_THET4|nr:uncharacterized protein MYCTH_2127280 [Thermothelomyces thermophilus ATCC 42464]AEO58243.1 hypothetical protein MYCTH_2127280 [Thermothelomyces thermophilus ATCC 42464]
MANAFGVIGEQIRQFLIRRVAALGGPLQSRCTAAGSSPTQISGSLLRNDGTPSPGNMRKYLERLERKQYANGLSRGHGKDGCLATELTPLSVAHKDLQLLRRGKA